MNEAKILKDRNGRFFAMTCRPLAVNFPIRINNQTYWWNKSKLMALLAYIGYTIKESE